MTIETKVENNTIPKLQPADSYGVLIIQYNWTELGPQSVPSFEFWQSKIKGAKLTLLGETPNRQVFSAHGASEIDFTLTLQTIQVVLDDTLAQATWIPISGAYRIRRGGRVEPCPADAVTL